MSAERSLASPHYPRLDWLRGGLALTVALGHDNIVTWVHAGGLAVEIFFAASGWLIGGILISSSRDALPRFYFNRATRIWIPYAIAIVLLLAAGALKDVISEKWIEFAVYKITFVYNIFGPPQLATHRADMPLGGTGNHFWSICAEEQFYLLAPFLLTVSLMVWIGLSIVAIATHTYAGIMLGVVAALLRNDYGDWHLESMGRRAVVATLVLSGVLLFSEVVSYWIVAPVFSICVVLFLATPGPENRIGAFVGGVSYPFYLNHWIGVFAANALMRPWGLAGHTPPRQLMALVINVLVCSALYWWVDRRIRQLRNRWFTEYRGRICALAGYGLVLTGLAFGMTR
jgi:peptidoglycan/LPS O-acetylase OafA/YrhL